MKLGDVVPDFPTLDQQGNESTFHGLLKAGPVVLFFYPKAFTPGCTKESCHFRDLASEFDEIGAQRIGISADNVEKQARFASEHQLGFPLLSDPDRSIAKTFGVKRMGPIPNKRATFVIGEDAKVLAVISSEVNMETHADQALEVLSGR